MNATMDLATLTTAWLAAKDAERIANAQRLEYERQIVLYLPNDGHEGTTSADVSDYRVRVTYRNTRAIDAEMLADKWDGLDQRARSAFSWKPEIRARELKALIEMAPDVYATVAPCLSTKPAKPSVTIEMREPEAA